MLPAAPGARGAQPRCDLTWSTLFYSTPLRPALNTAPQPSALLTRCCLQRLTLEALNRQLTAAALPAASSLTVRIVPVVAPPVPGRCLSRSSLLSLVGVCLSLLRPSLPPSLPRLCVVLIRTSFASHAVFPPRMTLLLTSVAAASSSLAVFPVFF
jgi:hypothetical protein